MFMTVSRPVSTHVSSAREIAHNTEDSLRSTFRGRIGNQSGANSVIRLQGLRVVIAQLLESTRFHFRNPFRILQQRATDRDKVELAAIEAFDRLIELACGRTFAAKRAGELRAQADGADADRR